MKRRKKRCPDCRAEMRYQKVQQEFEKEGTRVVVSGIAGWRCPNCHAVAYEPGIMDHVVKSARELFAAAQASRSGFASAKAAKSEMATVAPPVRDERNHG